MTNPFEGKFAEDYHLHQKVFPKRDAFQDKLGYEIHKMFSQQDGSILGFELGTGTGRTSESVLSKNPNLYLYGVDISQDMLNQARSNLSKYSQRVSFFQEDILNFLLINNGFSKANVIFSAFTLHNLKRDKRRNILDETYNNLAIGGAFFSLDLMYSDYRIVRKFQKKETLERLKIYSELGRADLTEKWTAHAQDDFKEDTILLKNEFENDIFSAGFSEVTCLHQEERYGIHMAVKK